MNYYNLYGFQIETEETLPFPAASTNLPNSKKVKLIRGKVPLHLDNPGREKILFQMCPGKTLITIPETVRFLVENSLCIQFELLNGTSLDDMVSFLLDTAFIALIYQNGLLPLLGTAVADQKDRVMLILGETPCGKSTLGHLLNQKGFSIVSDDCCVLKFKESAAGLIQPGLPYLTLHQSSLTILGLEPDNYGLIREGTPLFRVPFSPPKKELIVEKVIIIEGGYPQKNQIHPLYGKEKVTLFNNSACLPVYWGSGKNHNISMDALFQFYNKVPFYKLQLSKFENALFELPDILVDLWEDK